MAQIQRTKMGKGNLDAPTKEYTHLLVRNRILYSQSYDGLNWTKTDGKNILFPSLSTAKQACAMFVGPPIIINNRWYVGASPGVPTDAAAGAQFCLWPDPVTPRNCGPPGRKQLNNTLIMREILGFHSFGPLFWASRVVPSGWEEASEMYNVSVLSNMPSEIQDDIDTLSDTEKDVPCTRPESGNLKCEACAGGCQLYSSINIPDPSDPSKSAIGNERTHYNIPPGSPSDSSDVILYRSGGYPYLFASTRSRAGQLSWSPPNATNIPNDESNLNAGRLPDGRIYLLNNPVYRQKPNNSQVSELRFRNPVTIALSSDGYNFNKAVALISCTALTNSSTCAPRFAGGGKNPGPSYPQGLALTSPAPAHLQGFYAVVCIYFILFCITVSKSGHQQ
eukprot:m.138655 g.138655  ORF g.138655 m.138655 type:complete len:392 (-) comp14779_c0_seq16:2242-3417(-)